MTDVERLAAELLYAMRLAMVPGMSAADVRAAAQIAAAAA